MEGSVLGVSRGRLHISQKSIGLCKVIPMFGADCKEPDLLMDLLSIKISGELGSSQ